MLTTGRDGLSVGVKRPMSENPKAVIALDPDSKATMDRLSVALDNWRLAIVSFGAACVVAGQAIGDLAQAARDADEAATNEH